MLGSVGEKVGVAVLSAVILGALALVWQLATDGGLVRALGGMTRAEMEAALAAELDARLAAAPRGAVPAGAVVSFDVTGRCPEGWEPFTAGQSRAIVGASFGVDPDPGLGANEAGQPLVPYKYRDHGGVETVTLTVEQMPAHGHDVKIQNTGGIGGTHGLAAAADAGNQTTTVSELTGAEEARHNNMPPYLALYFCKKG